MRTTTKRFWRIARLGGFCLVLGALGCSGDDDDGGGAAPTATARATATAQPTATPVPTVFAASLRGDQEVGPVESLAAGTAAFTLSEDETTLEFDVGFSGLDPANVLQAHLHVAPVGENGPVVTFLIGESPTTTSFSGSLTDSDILPNEVGVASLADLITAIGDGMVYANIHSRAHPGGEIRGQLTRSE